MNVLDKLHRQVLICSILLAQLVATLVRYTYTVQLPGLLDWSAFLE